MARAPVVVGHRGAAAVAPENTLAGFLAAWESGCRVMELDVRLTADGVPVCFHDERLERLTPETGRPAEWEWAALSQVPVLPDAFGGAFPDARIPALRAVVEALPPECRFLVELKAEAERPDQLVSEVLGLLGNADALARSRVISFEADLLRRVDCCGLGYIGGPRCADLVATGEALRAEAIHPHWSLVDEALIEAAHGRGMVVNVWTVNAPEQALRLAELDVDEITTDHPAALLGRLPSG